MRQIKIILACVLLGAAPLTAQEVSDQRSRILTLGSTEVTADKGTLTVPENRTRRGSRSIELTWVRLRSIADEPGAPLFFLPGGPGNPAIPLARSPSWLPFLERGDVVLLDPRGTGESEPDLRYDSATIEPARFLADRETAVHHMAEVCAEAAAHFAGQGMDLSGYNPDEMADDLEALRVALGYPAVHALGHSFGTVLGQVWIRRHPDAVTRFVSVGTAGPYDMMKRPAQLDRSLDRLAGVVAADPTIGESMPDLYADVEDAVAVLRDEPLLVEVAEDGRTHQVPVGPFGLQLVLLMDLGDTSDLPVIPRLVRSVQDREPGMLGWFVGKRLQMFVRLPVFMLYCRGSAGATEERWAAIRDEAEICPFGMTRCLFSPEADAALGVVDLGDAFREPVHSDVPTLFVSGSLDAATPPEQAEEVRAGFPISGHVVVQYGGHEDLLSDEHVQAEIHRFLGGAPPRDRSIPRSPLSFAPLVGPASDVGHPALRRE